MCGLAGTFVPRSVGDDPAAMKDALRRLQHRGPDGEGIERFRMPQGCLTLGHRRLAIIDLSDNGLQPMTSGCGRYTIVFNGEIYNYLELRARLRGLGHRFRTLTDTEVLLTSWAEWGEDCLRRLDGMFAFVIYDHAEARLHCARDSFGIKPFFYRVDPQGVYFASEVQAILALLPQAPPLNRRRAYDYLCWASYDDGSDTFYDGVLQLRPGHFLTVDLTDIRTPEQTQWWWPSIRERNDLTLEQSAEELRELFLGSIRRQLRSDVALGAALSGGVDSSAIVCAIRHVEPDFPIHTFSYVARGSSLNEEEWSRIVAEHVGAIGHWTDYKSGDMGSDLDDIIIAQGEPFQSTSIAAQYRVFRLAREHGVTVVLDGQGADELLAGYHGYPAARFRTYLDQYRYLDLLRFGHEWTKWPGRTWKQAAIHLGDATLPAPLRATALRLIGRNPVPEWLIEDGLRGAAFEPAPPPPFEGGDDARGRRLAARLRGALCSDQLPSLLRHADRNSMRWSIESRVPFLSPAIAEFTLRLPESHLLSPQSETKHVFRLAMRGIVPDVILNRRDKIGFATPEQELLVEQRSRIDTWLGAAPEMGFVDVDKLKSEVNSMLEGRTPFTKQTWRMINYCRWASLQPNGVVKASAH